MPTILKCLTNETEQESYRTIMSNKTVGRQRPSFMRPFSNGGWGSAAILSLIICFVKSSTPPLNAAPNARSVLICPLTLRLHGFESDTLTVPAGMVLISIQNRSGSPELLFHVIRDSGVPPGDINIHGYNNRGVKLLSLSAGNYTIVEANQPKWICRLTVQ
jgi:hypothetical protein